MALWGTKTRRGEKLMERLQESLDQAPLVEMEELITLAQLQASVKRAVIEQTQAMANDGALHDIVYCWFVLVAGELGREGLLLAIDGLGRSEGDAPDETAIPTLTRHILGVLPDVLREIHLSEAFTRRLALYETLEGALLLGDAQVKERLRTFALERWEVERSWPKPELLDEPLYLLYFLGDTKLGERVREARSLCRPGEQVYAQLDDVENLMRGGMDFLDRARQIVGEDWKATARHLERAFNVGASRERPR